MPVRGTIARAAKRAKTMGFGLATLTLATTISAMRIFVAAVRPVRVHDASVGHQPLPALPTPTAPVNPTLVNQAVNALRIWLSSHGYNLTPEENAALDLRDAYGRLACVIIIQGFPVNGTNRWLNPQGTMLAESMKISAIQLAALGLLGAGTKATAFVAIDIHPPAKKWNAGATLDRAVTAKAARRTPLDSSSPDGA
jgi:hypothetical protein